MNIKFIRISALLIAFSLIFQTCAFARDEITVEQSSLSFEREALEKMELVTDELLALDGADAVSRALFIGNMFKMSGFVKTAYDSSDNPFADLTEDTLFRDEIISFYKRGLISGTGENTFSPDVSITVAQAVKISLDMLGYREYINARYSGSMEGYLITASDLEITDGMSFDGKSDYLTAYDAFVLMYNAGITPVYETNSITMDDGGYTERYQKGDILLSARDIYYDEGIVQGNGLVDISG
ncbi:MAG: S-layer homology domain-containing protein, partial [Clostridia bacterium]|nr:S-layer homology domain-containing protein [Clostridia bacterium]